MLAKVKTEKSLVFYLNMVYAFGYACVMTKYKHIQLYTRFEIILTCGEFDSRIMDRIFWKFNFSDQRYYQQKKTCVGVYTILN